jgi:hypothetical protein
MDVTHTLRGERLERLAFDMDRSGRAWLGDVAQHLRQPEGAAASWFQSWIVESAGMPGGPDCCTTAGWPAYPTETPLCRREELLGANAASRTSFKTIHGVQLAVQQAAMMSRQDAKVFIGGLSWETTGAWVLGSAARWAAVDAGSLPCKPSASSSCRQRLLHLPLCCR